MTPLTFDVESKDDRGSQKRKLYEEDVLLMRCAFLRGSYISDSELPKTRLLKWTKENRKKMPVYDTRREDKLFCSVVTVDGKKYGSSFWYVKLSWCQVFFLFPLGFFHRDLFSISGKKIKSGPNKAPLWYASVF